MFSGMRVEHELRQCPMQSRQAAAQNREARSGKLGRRLGIQQAVALAQRDMVQGLEIKRGNIAPAANLLVGRLIFADRHVIRGDIRHIQMPGQLLITHFAKLALGRVQLLAQLLDLLQQRLNVLAPGFRLADGLGAGIALILQFLNLLLQGFAPAFQFGVARGIQDIAAVEQAGGHSGRAFSQ